MAPELLLKVDNFPLLTEHPRSGTPEVCADLLPWGWQHSPTLESSARHGLLGFKASCTPAWTCPPNVFLLCPLEKLAALHVT